MSQNIKVLLFCLFLGFPFISNAQINPPDEDNDWSDDNLEEIEFTIPDNDAFYKDGIQSLQNYIANNFNFNNVTIKDVPEDQKDTNNYLIYIGFDIDDTGKPENFSSENISTGNSFFREAVRVISSTRWEPAVRNATEIKQHLIIPIILRIDDLTH